MIKQAIVTLEGNSLYQFVTMMAELIAHHDDKKGPDTIEVIIQEDGLKFKADYGIWTPGIGETRTEG